jgi:hypothetical protein
MGEMTSGVKPSDVAGASRLSISLYRTWLPTSTSLTSTLDAPIAQLPPSSPVAPSDPPFASAAPPLEPLDDAPLDAPDPLDAAPELLPPPEPLEPEPPDPLLPELLAPELPEEPHAVAALPATAAARGSRRISRATGMALHLA